MLTLLCAPYYLLKMFRLKTITVVLLITGLKVTNVDCKANWEARSLTDVILFLVGLPLVGLPVTCLI